MIESGDSVKLAGHTSAEVIPMTVYEIENGKALCGGYSANGEFVGDWFDIQQLVVVSKGNTNG